jgi:hypothetical protein
MNKLHFNLFSILAFPICCLSFETAQSFQISTSSDSIYLRLSVNNSSYNYYKPGDSVKNTANYIYPTAYRVNNMSDGASFFVETENISLGSQQRVSRILSRQLQAGSYYETSPIYATIIELGTSGMGYVAGHFTGQLKSKMAPYSLINVSGSFRILRNFN